MSEEIEIETTDEGMRRAGGAEARAAGGSHMANVLEDEKAATRLHVKTGTGTEKFSSS